MLTKSNGSLETRYPWLSKTFMVLELSTSGLGLRISTVVIWRAGCSILIIVPPKVRAIISHPKQIPSVGIFFWKHDFKSEELIALFSLLLARLPDKIIFAYECILSFGTDNS